MFDKPIPTVSIIQDGEYWVVVTHNADGKEEQKRSFRSRAEANAFWLHECGSVKNQE